MDSYFGKVVHQLIPVITDHGTKKTFTGSQSSPLLHSANSSVRDQDPSKNSNYMLTLYLNVSEKLVIEVRVSFQFFRIQWGLRI